MYAVRVALTSSWKAVNDMITGYFFAMCSSPIPSLMALLSIHISSGTTLKFVYWVVLNTFFHFVEDFLVSASYDKTVKVT